MLPTSKLDIDSRCLPAHVMQWYGQSRMMHLSIMSDIVDPGGLQTKVSLGINRDIQLRVCMALPRKMRVVH